MDAYPEIDTIPNKVAQMQKAGYIPVASFILPENCWTEHFYAPQVAAQEAFLKNMLEIALSENLSRANDTKPSSITNIKPVTATCFISGRRYRLCFLTDPMNPSSSDLCFIN
jgi:hypothetical protein